MKNLIVKLVTFGSMVFAAHGALGQEPDARLLRLVNPSQSISIHIGDVLERKIEIEVQQPYQLSRNALPLKGSNQLGIELADIEVDTSQREQKTIYTIALRYQVFANAHTPGAMQLPAEEFALTGGPKALSVRVPAWRFWFSPLVAANVSYAKESLQPQYRPALVETGEHRARMAFWLALFITGLFGLIYINADGRWLPYMNGAFAQAHRNLKKLPKTRDGERAALFCLHQAFNRVYGASMFAGDIAAFLQAHPRFFRLKAEIASFFERSNRSLFDDQDHDSAQFINDLTVLGKILRDCERGAS